MATSILLSHPFLTKPKIPYQSSNPYHFPHLKPIKHNPFKTHLPNALISSKKSLLLRVLKTESEGSEVSPLVGEDSAEFELSNQKISSWVYFSGILGTVLYILNVAWIDNSSGYGKVFGEAISSVSESPEVVMLALILIFAIVHSGLASLRDRGEKLIGERAFRVLLAGVSLPLAVTTVVYFISHRYDGVQLWQLQGTPGLHEIVWISNFITLFFLYPSIFNLLEVAAVDKPKMHLWETGIMRITRHPQLLILKQILVHVTWESESFGLVSPAASFVPWSTRNKVEFKMSQLPVQKSCFNGTKFGHAYSNLNPKGRTIIFCCTDRTPNNTKKRDVSSQNIDLPPILPKKKKKPYPIPLKKIQQAAKADKKLAQMGIEKPLEPPKNGIVAPELIPVAHDVLDSWKTLIRGIAHLLHVVPVHACSECSEIHVAQTGHNIQDCRGPTSGSRKGFHSWVKGSINDVLIPIESYHMYDPFGRRIKHETRFSFERIPALVELCIQAGVDIPEFPSRRRTKPIRMLGKKVIDNGGFVDEPKINISSSSIMEIDTHRAMERFPLPNETEIPKIAFDTIEAYERVKRGLAKLMRKYTVKACGYCSEVHVGPCGHNAKLCGEFKHQWRDGKHGWQDATLDEVFPPNYVWHVEDPKGPALTSALKSFYGKVPAVVEVCVQAGARVPNKYKPMMRLDIVVPENEEARLVA